MNFKELSFGQCILIFFAIELMVCSFLWPDPTFAVVKGILVVGFVAINFVGLILVLSGDDDIW